VVLGNKKAALLFGRGFEQHRMLFMQPSSLPRGARRTATTEDGAAKCHGGYMRAFAAPVNIRKARPKQDFAAALRASDVEEHRLAVALDAEIDAVERA
jgi:hypothetical protein